MKTVLKPLEPEKAEYRSDFSDKVFSEFGPDVTIKFDFDYGSRLDGEALEFHLTDDEAKHVLDFITMNLSDKKAKDLHDKFFKYETKH